MSSHRRRLAPVAYESLLSATLLGAMLLVASRGWAKEPASAAQPFESTVEVRETLIDVLVTDRDGNVILGLRPADFQVREAGKPLEITAATFYSNRRFLESAGRAAGASGLGLDPAAVPDRRLFVLLFDDQSRLDATDPTLLLSRQLRAGRDTAAWLRKGLEPGDLIAVASFDSRLRLQQDFTAETAMLERAVDRAVRSADEPKEWPSRTGAAADLPALAATLPTGTALRDATPGLEKALSVLADAAAPITGRKNLILFSSGFGRTGALGYQPEQRLFRELIEALNAANIAVYPADLAPAEAAHPLSSALSRLADETGGRPFFQLTSFDLPLERVAATTNGYYLVSFRTSHLAGSGGYREIEVTAANPEFRVTARRGYRP